MEIRTLSEIIIESETATQTQLEKLLDELIATKHLRPMHEVVFAHEHFGSVMDELRDQEEQINQLLR